MKACQQCREAKRKCLRSKTDLLASCTRCVRRQLACSNRQHQTASRLRTLGARPACPSQSPPPTVEVVSGVLSQSPVDAFLADDTAVAELVGHYVAKIHDRPHSIFHVATLWKDIRQKTIAKALLLAICAVGAHLSSEPAARSIEPVLTAESKRLLQADLEHVSVENIQTAILLANICAAHANPSSEYLFFRMGTSMMEILNSSTKHTVRNAIDHELRIRLWWALFMADNWCSSSLGLPRQMKESARPGQLPVDEQFFASLTPEDPVSVVQSCHVPGLWAHMSTLVELFPAIQELNRRVVHRKDSNQSQLEQDTDQIAQQLDSWQEKLPAETRLTEFNLIEHSKRGTGGVFLALHLGWHHYSTLLYYQYLDEAFTETPQSRRFASRCKSHALGYSTLLARGRQQLGCETVYHTVGHMTTVSSSVLLHTLLFGAEDELPQSRHGLKANFEALLELENYWPSVKIMINRLMNFQKNCLLSAHNHTHRVDRWMVRFLFEYALPLDDKTLDAVHSVSELEIISSQEQIFSQQGRLATFGNIPGASPD